VPTGVVSHPWIINSKGHAARCVQPRREHRASVHQDHTFHLYVMWFSALERGSAHVRLPAVIQLSCWVQLSCWARSGSACIYLTPEQNWSRSAPPVGRSRPIMNHGRLSPTPPLGHNDLRVMSPTRVRLLYDEKWLLNVHLGDAIEYRPEHKVVLDVPPRDDNYGDHCGATGAEATHQPIVAAGLGRGSRQWCLKTAAVAFQARSTFAVWFRLVAVPSLVGRQSKGV